MTVSLSTVRSSRPEALLDAATELGGKATRLQTVIVGERELLAQLQSSWEGDAASAAIAKGLRLIGEQERFCRRLQQMQSALQNGGEQLRALRNATLDLVETVMKMGFSVSDDGTVTPQQWLIGGTGLLKSIAHKLTTAIQKLLETFGVVDAATAAAIDQARGSSMSNAPVKVADKEIQMPSPDAKPEDVKKWWDSLTDAQRQGLIARHPPLLGNLNGVPADVRDKVNVQVMDDDLDRVENVADQHHVSPDDVAKDPGRYGLSESDITRYQNAKKTQEGLLHDLGIDVGKDHRRYSDIPESERHDKALRPTMLWAYDPQAFNGKGKAAIAIGNPDKLPNAAVIVPGTGSSVQSGWLSDGHDDAKNLYDQSLKADPAHPTAVIAWMGYDTPSGFNDPNVGNPALARTGGDALAWDVNSLSATHDRGVPQHVTVIGHSYGSTTVADAFANSGMQANDAVLLGCPGTDMAKSAADFHLYGGQVYVGDASTDPVGWIGESGAGLPNILNDALGNPIGTEAGLGGDPAHEGFGATRFKAEVPGTGDLEAGDHSYYYHVGSESLRSMTEIVSGHGANLAGDGLLAGQRTDVHVTTPKEIHIPVIGDVPLPHIDVGTPIPHDPESDRPRESVTDDHQYR